MNRETKGRILVVDDEGQIREVCRRGLTGAGFSVDTAEDGEKAVKAFEAGRHDLVLTDLHMPGSVDGSALVREVKQRSPEADVIVMTAFPTLETAIETLKRGAYDYLLKPFTPDYLQRVVLRVFEKRSLERELDREKTLRQELISAYAELQKVERLKSAFLARLNHELRTPLTAAMLAAEHIASLEAGGPAGRERVAMLQSRLEKMQEVIEELLSFSDLRSNGVQLRKAPVDIEKTIGELIRKYKRSLEDKRIRVETSLDGAGSLLADPRLFSTALRHLFLNSIHFNKPGGRVSILARREGDDVRIAFTDTGIGIPDNKLPMIYDSFYQVAEHLTREVGGLGLGLATVRRIVEAHGGAIFVTSEEGSGSTFTVCLPANGAGRSSKSATKA